MLPAEGGGINLQAGGYPGKPALKVCDAGRIERVDVRLVEGELENVLVGSPGNRQHAHSLCDFRIDLSIIRAAQRSEVLNVLHQQLGIRSILVDAVAVVARS